MGGGGEWEEAIGHYFGEGGEGDPTLPRVVIDLCVQPNGWQMAAQITGFSATEAIGKDLVATYIREDQVRAASFAFALGWVGAERSRLLYSFGLGGLMPAGGAN